MGVYVILQKYKSFYIKIFGITRVTFKVTRAQSVKMFVIITLPELAIQSKVI
jgi:hypothetical protein